MIKSKQKLWLFRALLISTMLCPVFMVYSEMLSEYNSNWMKYHTIKHELETHSESIWLTISFISLYFSLVGLFFQVEKFKYLLVFSLGSMIPSAFFSNTSIYYPIELLFHKIFYLNTGLILSISFLKK